MSNKEDGIDRVIVRTLIRNDKDEILVVRRSKSGKRAGEWELPGGHLDEGESLEQGALRETVEETGLKLDKISFFNSNAYKADGESRIGVIFSGKTKETEIKLSYEHDKFEWINSSNYNNIKWRENYQELFDNLFTLEKELKLDLQLDENTTTKYEVIHIYTDGGSRGNPGPSASGYVIMNGKRELLEEGGEYLGITTNNQAEYQAVKLALEAAKKFHPKRVEMYIDSLLVVNQMNGVYKIKNRDLWPIHQFIKEQVVEIGEVKFSHVRRERNKLADAKVNEVLDSHEHRE